MGRPQTEKKVYRKLQRRKFLLLYFVLSKIVYWQKESCEKVLEEIMASLFVDETAELTIADAASFLRKVL